MDVQASLKTNFEGIRVNIEITLFVEPNWLPNLNRGNIVVWLMLFKVMMITFYVASVAESLVAMMMMMMMMMVVVVMMMMMIHQFNAILIPYNPKESLTPCV